MPVKHPVAVATPDALDALASRVEAYDPFSSMDNRGDEMPIELDVAKALALVGDDAFVARGSVTGFMDGDGRGGHGNPKVEPYCRSLDAAVSAMPAGCSRQIGDARHDPEDRVVVTVVGWLRTGPQYTGMVRSRAATDRLSTLAAALRAHAAIARHAAR